MTPLQYEVDLGARLQHLVRVRMTVPADLAPGARLAVATWTPGSYVERDYVHHLQSITASTATGQQLGIVADGHTSWLLDDGVEGEVVVELEWYANELTVRTNHVDDHHALLVPPATFPTVVGAEDRPAEVSFTDTGNAGAKVHGLLPRDGGGVFHAQDALHLVDSAFECGAFPQIEFEVDGVPHRWVHASHGGPIDLDRVAADVTAIARAARDVFGGPLPIEEYTFLCVGADARTGGGGLEHRDGSVLMLPVLTDAHDDGVTRTRSLIAHEYLHLWNVKRLVPAELVDLRLDRPTHTPSLWVAEGWTAFYDDLLPTRAGLTSTRTYLDALRDALRWVQRTPGAARQSVADASWHAWTGLYVRDENSVNAGTNYYTHGAVIAACLDLLIRSEDSDGDGLDEAFRLLWQRFGHAEPRGYPTTGYTTDDVTAAVSDAAGTDLGGFIADHVLGTTAPPLADLLDVVGCRVKHSDPSTPSVDLGVLVDEDDRGPRVTAALRDGPAWRAGVTGGDRIVAVDDVVIGRGELQRVLASLTPARPVVVTVERGPRLLDLTVEPGPPRQDMSIVAVDEPTDEQAAAFRRWTGGQLGELKNG